MKSTQQILAFGFISVILSLCSAVPEQNVLGIITVDVTIVETDVQQLQQGPLSLARGDVNQTVYMMTDDNTSTDSEDVLPDPAGDESSGDGSPEHVESEGFSDPPMSPALPVRSIDKTILGDNDDSYPKTALYSNALDDSYDNGGYLPYMTAMRVAASSKEISIASKGPTVPEIEADSDASGDNADIHQNSEDFLKPSIADEVDIVLAEFGETRERVQLDTSTIAFVALLAILTLGSGTAVLVFLRRKTSADNKSNVYIIRARTPNRQYQRLDEDEEAVRGQQQPVLPIIL